MAAVRGGASRVSDREQTEPPRVATERHQHDSARAQRPRQFRHLALGGAHEDRPRLREGRVDRGLLAGARLPFAIEQAIDAVSRRRFEQPGA